jgi:hypothetical protein
MALKQELEQDIELAQMMVDDMDKVYNKYARAAYSKQQERIEQVRNEKYKGCENVEELRDLYGYGDMSEDEYYAGISFFESREIRKSQLSLIEKHRVNLKEIRDRWKGTVNELGAELDVINGVVKDTRTYIQIIDAQERTKRYALLR